MDVMKMVLGAVTPIMSSKVASAFGVPQLKSSSDALLAETTIGPILKPVLDRVLAKLTAFGG